MNKKLILIVLSVAMFCSASYAQKVIKNGSAVIIDCSDMNPKFYSSTKIEPRTTTATDFLGPTNGAADISSPESNAKVYKKFEVQGTDNTGTSYWLGAVTLCAGLNSNGTGWRIPTQRELMLIWILKDKLMANGVKPFTAKPYWSATHDKVFTAWNVDLSSSGITSTDKKESSLPVRCVRDL